MPAGLAQNSLYELCREKKVPVYDIIIEKIRVAANEVNLEDGRIFCITEQKVNKDKSKPYRRVTKSGFLLSPLDSWGQQLTAGAPEHSIIEAFNSF